MFSVASINSFTLNEWKKKLSNTELLEYSTKNFPKKFCYAVSIVSEVTETC